MNERRLKWTRRGLIGAGALTIAGTSVFAFRRAVKTEAKPAPADSKTLHRGNAAEPETLDPHRATTPYEANIIGDMFIGLMTENAAGDAVQGAARNFVQNADGTRYTFTLRDHKWSDGTPVSADDFVYSFRRALSPKTGSQYASILYPVKNAKAVHGGEMAVEKLGIHARGPRVVRIDFEYQVPYLRYLLTHFVSFAVPRHIVEKYGDAWTAPANIATNGAYTLKAWVPNSQVELIKNPHFYEAEKVAIERVLYHPVPDFATALKRFRAGELDINNSVPSQEIAWLRVNMPEALHLAPFILTQYALFNFTRKPFDDVRVRTALSMAVDRDIIARRVMHAGERPAYALVPPHMPGYPARAQIKFRNMAMAERIAKARALLAEAGFGPGKPLKFEFSFPAQTDAKLVAAALQAMWENIGAEAKLLAAEDSAHYTRLRKQNFSVAWAGWVADYRDARNYLHICETSSHDVNYGRYSNPRFDNLIAQSDRARETMQRAILLEQAEQVMLDDVAVAPVYFGASRGLVAKSVKGWIDTPADINRTRYLSLARDGALS